MNLLSGMNTEKLLNSFLIGMKPEKKAEYLNKFDRAFKIAEQTQADFELIKNQNAEILDKLRGIESFNNFVEELKELEKPEETIAVSESDETTI
jgi:phage regulator Rha-like protein